MDASTQGYIDSLQGAAQSRAGTLLANYAQRLRQPINPDDLKNNPDRAQAMDAVVTPEVATSTIPAYQQIQQRLAERNSDTPQTPQAPQAPGTDPSQQPGQQQPKSPMSPGNSVANGLAGIGLNSLVNGGSGEVAAGSAIPDGFTAVGSAMDGGTVIAPSAAVNGAGVGAMGGAAATAGLGGMAALAANNLWEGGVKNIAAGHGTSKDWTNTIMNSNPLTAWIDPVTRVFGLPSVGKALFGGGKSNDQRERDAVRAWMQQNGGVDKDWNVTLADGSKFNIGLEGGAKQANGMNMHEVDTKNPLSNVAMAGGGLLGFLLAGGNDNKNIRDGMGGYFANAAMSNAKGEGDVWNNIASIMHSMGIAPTDVASALQSSGINKDELAARMGTLNQITSAYTKLYGNGAQPSGGGGGGGFSLNIPMPSMPKSIPAPIQQDDGGGLLAKLAQQGGSTVPVNNQALFNNAIQAMFSRGK